MVIASELRSGMVVRIDDHLYKVLEVEFKAGAAKLSSVMKTKLRDVLSGRMWEPHFRSEERLEGQDGSAAFHWLTALRNERAKELLCIPTAQPFALASIRKGRCCFSKDNGAEEHLNWSAAESPYSPA